MTEVLPRRKFRLGRKPRAFDARIPKWSAIEGAPRWYPPEVDYAPETDGLGMMLNDTLGDCTIAAAGHAIQVWTALAAGVMVTVPDSAVETFYELAGGYVPGDPATDQGCVEQTVLADWMTGKWSANELAAYVELDPSNWSQVMSAVYECGCVYIGFEVPAYLPEDAGATWDVDPNADNTIEGGHCVIVVGYDQASEVLTLISWGAVYYMTRAFWNEYVDEAYALADADWIQAMGATPAGLTLAELKNLMSGFGGAPGPKTRRQKRHRRQKRRGRRGQRPGQIKV